MDIYGYIKKDHRRFEDLFEQVINASDAKTREPLFLTLKTELVVHAKAEEQTLYEAIEAATRSKRVEEKIEHTYEEHDEIEEFLDKLSSVPMESDEWMIHFGELKHACTHHFEEEEGELFEKAKTYLEADKAKQLAKDMDAIKNEMMAAV